MARNNIETRLTALEAEVVRLRNEVARLGQAKDWQSVVGMFAGDEFMKQVDEAGRRIRQQDRRQSPLKQKYRKKPRLARS